MKKPRPPKSIKEVEDYVREKNLSVDPAFFWEFFTDGDWYDSNDKPVLNWKQKILTWHREQLERGRSHRCSYGSFGTCKKPGIYPAGRDRDGHPLWRCIDHKPRFKPKLPEELTNVFKEVHHHIDLNQRRNEEMEKLR